MNDNSKLKVALIGCGRIATKHAEVLTSGQIPNALLVGVVDNLTQRSQEFSRKYSVPSFSTIANLFDKLQPDIISVLTPSGTHYSNVLELCKYDVDIIVEKPIALSTYHAELMIKACNDNNSRLFVVKQNRFNLPVTRLKEALINKKFGKLVMGTVRVRWCRKQSYYDQAKWRGTLIEDGGVLANQASHHIDLLLWMLGEVKSVMAMTRTALVDIESPDTALVIVRFKNGALGSIEATTATRPQDLEGSLSILGEKGTVVIGGFAVNKIDTWEFNDSLSCNSNLIDNFSNNPPDVYGYGHIEFYKHVVDCILKNKTQLIDGAEATKTVKLIEAINQSVTTGKEIFL